jgi:hypothetical protein
MVDYVIDLEFDSKRQPFLDALIDHPKLETFITATFDAARLVTKHRSTFSNKGEAYSALVRPYNRIIRISAFVFPQFN